MTVSREQLEAIRRSRRHPRRTQFDYLHIRALVNDLEYELAAVPGPVHDVLDVYCGSRPYDDLMPQGARIVGIDVEGNPYGVADVVSNEFLPFEDASFDLVTCIEAFHYVVEPEAGVTELRRVLRPGGMLLIALPFAWEYDRKTFERRFTEPELLRLFEGWEGVRVLENGGRGVVWTTLTGTMLERLRLRSPAPVRAVGSGLYVALNGLGALLEGLERRYARDDVAFPMNLLLTARKPAAHD